MAKKDKYGYRETYPRFYKADKELQQKVGTGALDNETIGKAQSFLDGVNVDVTAEIREALAAIRETVDEAAKLKYDREQFLPKITKQLMNIKANSGMFHQMMVCRVSSFVLTFLEDVRKLDRDVLDILKAYVTVSKTLLDLKVKDETDPHGQSFLAEIRNATKRYYDKYEASVKG